MKVLYELKDAEILVTGIAGQIGSRFAEILKQEGISFRGIDILDINPSYPYLKYNLSDRADIDRLRCFIKPATHVIHLASRMSNESNIEKGVSENFNINVLSTVNLLNALSRETKHLAFASTMTVYGIPDQLPVRETSHTQPDNLYAATKLMTEKYLSVFSKKNSLPIAVLRYSSVYGPGRITDRAIPRIIENVIDGCSPLIKGSGSTVRDYIYIDDVVYATLVSSAKHASSIINIGTGVGTSLKQLAEKIIELSQESVELKFDLESQDGHSIYYDISKMKNELEYVPCVTLSDGLATEISWHKLRRECDE
jgi:UDP-glucose 4-epimerase